MRPQKDGNMRRIRLTVSYDGTNYCGSQVQPNGVTIEEKLNEAIKKLTGDASPVSFLIASFSFSSMVTPFGCTCEPQ